MIYVTHDQVEAMTLGQRLVLMNHGVVQQVDTPLEVYNNPANRFVATFIGSPPMNLIEGVIQGGRFTADGVDASWSVPGVEADGPATLGVRPEDLMPAEGSAPVFTTGRLGTVERLGHEDARALPARLKRPELALHRPTVRRSEHAARRGRAADDPRRRVAAVRRRRSGQAAWLSLAGALVPSDSEQRKKRPPAATRERARRAALTA